jgi:glucose uptake protein GlcU
VASIWGVLVFREIRGRKSLIFLAFGFLFAITGAVLVGFSF